MDSSTDKKLFTIIQSDAWMIHVLRTVRSLDLNDCWIGAGFVRNKVWDVLHKKERTVLNDVDVIYFDASNSTSEKDVLLENKLKSI